MSKVRRGSDQFPLRFPDGMRDALKERAARAGRSLNAEIVQILSTELNLQSNDEADMGEPKRTLNEQFMLRLPDGMRNEIAAKADENARSMTQEIVLALRAHLDGGGGANADLRIMLAGQAMNGFLAANNGVNLWEHDVLHGDGPINAARNCLALADMLIEEASKP